MSHTVHAALLQPYARLDGNELLWMGQYAARLSMDSRQLFERIYKEKYVNTHLYLFLFRI